MKRRIIRLISSMYDESGINVSTEKRKIWRFVLLVTNFVIVLISLAMSSIVNLENFDEFVAPLTFLTAGSSMTGNAYIIFHYRQTISRMLHEIDENLYTYPDSNIMDIKYPWYLREKNLIVAIYSVFIFELSIVTMMFCPSFIEMIFQHKISNFAYPTWTPWELDSFRSRMMTLFLQVFQGFGAIWVIYITLISIVVMVFEFLRQFVRLRIALCSLKQRTEMSVLLGERGKDQNLYFEDEQREKDQNLFSDYEQTKDENSFLRGQQNEIDQNTSIFHTTMRRNIVSCIQHHQILYKNFHLFKIWYSKIFSLELASCVMTFFTGFFCLANAPSASKMINYIGVAVVVNVNILLKCLIGEVFSELNNDTANVIFYDINWREMNGENRRLLVLFHRILHRPFGLFGFSIIKANRITFSKIIRFAYSSFNIVNMSLKKKKL